MIRTSDFNSALTILNRFVEPESNAAPLNVQFNEEYMGQPPMQTTLKIVHKVITEGSEKQRNQLPRNKIEDLNKMLLDRSSLQERLDTLGFKEDINDIYGTQVALPLTTSEKMSGIVSVIPRGIVSSIIDISMLPFALGLLGVASIAQINFDPTREKYDRIPILLLHGSGFNETEWVVGRQFLKKDRYGAVFSLNYDGLVSNDPNKGIDDYAREKVRAKILEIQELTGQNRIMVIGHSMGGLIAGYYAENLASEDGMIVEHIITIASPWKGAPLLEYKNNLDKRYRQMSVKNAFLDGLVSRAIQSEREGKRKYYCIGSTTDFMVPAPSSNLTEDPRRQRTFSYLGHYGLIASPIVWSQVCSWLDSALLEKSADEEQKLEIV